jgi:hypothetical protein
MASDKQDATLRMEGWKKLARKRQENKKLNHKQMTR